MEIEGRLIGLGKEGFGTKFIKIEMCAEDHKKIMDLYLKTSRMSDIWISMKTEVKPED